MRKAGLLFILSLFAVTARAQSTSVSATITDSDGIVWANGSVSVTFVPTPGNPGPYIWNGVPMTDAQKGPYAAALNGSGAFTLSLPDNSTISPSGSQWLFAVCPNASAVCTQIRTPVTGASQSFTTLFSSLVKPPRFPATGSGAYGYSNVEINQIPVPGGSYYNVTSLCVEIWSGSAFGCTSGGGAITGSIASTQVAVGTGANTIGGFNNFTFTSNSLTLPGIDNIRYVDGVTYPKTAAGINAAIASASGSPVWVMIPFPGNYADATINPANGAVLNWGAGGFSFCGISGADSNTGIVTWAIVGQGRDQTKLTESNGCNKDGITDQNFATLLSGNNYYGVYHAVLSGFTLDGNKANNSTGYGIRGYGRAWHVDDVVVQNFANDGMRPTYTGASNYTLSTDDDTWMVTNSAENLNGGNGFTFYVSSDGNLVNNVAWGNGAWGYETFYSLFVQNINAFLEGTGGCHSNGSTGSGAGFIGSGAECTNASASPSATNWGFLSDANSGDSLLSASIFACNNCIGAEVLNASNVLDGSFDNSLYAVKFTGSGAIGNTIKGSAFANTTLINWNGGGGLSNIDLVGSNSSGSIFSGAIPGNAQIFINGGLISPQGGPIGTFSVASGGSGYVPGDQFYINCGTGTAEGIVSTVSGSAVASFVLNSQGNNCSVASGVTTTVAASLSQPGVGSGLTVNVLSILSQVYTQHVDGPFGVLTRPNEWDFKQTFDVGIVSIVPYKTTAVTTPGILTGVTNNMMADDTGLHGIGIQDYCNGMKCGIGIQISSGGGTTSDWEIGQQIVYYNQFGLVLQPRTTGPTDIQILPNANDSNFAIQETNAAQNANVFTLDHLGNIHVTSCTGCGSGGGVASLNSLTGALTLAGSGGITITPSGSTITIGGGGGSGVTIATNGTNNAVQTTLNFIPSSVNSCGLLNTPINPATTGNEREEITGTTNAPCGGSGLSSPTTHDLMVAEGASPFNLVSMAVDTILQGQGSADPAPLALTNCVGANAYNTSTHSFVCNALPGNTPGVTHEFVSAYNSGTGVFTLTQPALSDLTGTGNIVFNNQANTYSTGLQDFSAVTMKVPSAAAFVTTASSTFGIDTTTTKNPHAWLNGADAIIPVVSGSWVNGNCGSIVFSGGQYAISDNGSPCGSGTTTAYSTLTAGVTSHAGTFGGSGNTWDYTASTIFKLRTGTGLTTSASGDIGEDTTAAMWHAYNGADSFIFEGLVSGTFTNNDCPKISKSGSQVTLVDSGAGCGGVGTVTTFSAGNANPLFTTAVSNPTTTPALSFTITTQNSNLIYAGPTSGGAATPTFRALVATDIPTGISITGNAATATNAQAVPTVCNTSQPAYGVNQTAWNALCVTTVGALYGGTGANSSAATGLPYITAGAWAFSNTIPAAAILGNGVTASTQTTGDNTTKVATDVFVNASIAAGGFIANPMITLGDTLYGGASGIPTRLAGVSANGLYNYTANVTASTQVAPAWLLPGVLCRTVSGTTDTLLYSDRALCVRYTSASAVAVTVPQANSTGFGSGYITQVSSEGGGVVTFTFTTSTATVLTGATVLNGQTSFMLSQGQYATIKSPDNTNYLVTAITGAGTGNVANCATQYAIFYAASAPTTQATCNPNLKSDISNDLFVGGKLIDMNGGFAAYAGTPGTSGKLIGGAEGTGPTCKAAWDFLWADSANHIWTMCNNNGPPSAVASKTYVNGGITPSSATGAITGPIQVGYVSCTQATPCASSATTLFTTSSATALYRADVSADCTSSVSLATVSVTLTYTDPSGTVQTSSIGSAAVCTTLGSASVMNFSTPFAAKNATNIQYNVTTANTPSYQARVAIFQESTN